MSTKELSGRELSAAVAECVFAEPMPPIPAVCTIGELSSEPSPKGAWLHVHVYDHGDVCEWEPLPFSESAEAAMQVVEEMRKRGFRFAMSNTVNGTDWAIEVDDGNCRNEIYKDGPTLSITICRAALTAIESKA